MNCLGLNGAFIVTVNDKNYLRTKQRLQKINCENYEKFQGIIPNNLGAYRNSDWPFIGMRGCILSQIEILKISNERGYKSVLIIEDDVIFHPNFGILWDKLLPKVQALEYDIFYGYDWYRQKQDDIENPIELSRLYRNLCTHFVVFNGDFVPKAIELQEKSEKRGVPLDITFNDNSNILMVAPSCNLVGQDEGNSLCCGGEYRPLRWRDSDG